MNICVVGGVNMDVIGRALSTLAPGDSNIGEIRFAPGGVGYNIAGRLALTGVKTRLITVLSRDAFGDMLINDCARRGIDIHLALKSNSPCSVYMSIHEPGGDMALAVNDMCLIDELTPEYLQGVIDYINDADACALDANLPEDSLEYLSKRARVKLVADPVSCVKAARLAPALARLDAIKPNLMEARALTGEPDAPSAARALLSMGVKRAIISLGEAGAYYADARESGQITPPERFACQTTGAGDAMCAGIAIGVANNESARQCAQRGLTQSALMLSSRY